MNTPTVVVLFALLAGAPSGVREPKNLDLEVAAIEPLLFEKDDGEFRPLQSAEAQAFGDLAVKVKLSGKGEAYVKSRKLKLEVKVGKLVLLSQEQEAASLNLKGTGWRFFFAPTGLICGEAVLTATLIGQPTPTSVTRTIRFACSE